MKQTRAKMRSFGFVSKKRVGYDAWSLKDDFDPGLIYPKLPGFGYTSEWKLFPPVIKKLITKSTYPSMALLIVDLEKLVDAGMRPEVVARFIRTLNHLTLQHPTKRMLELTLEDYVFFANLEPNSAYWQRGLLIGDLSRAEVQDMLDQGAPYSLIQQLAAGVNATNNPL
jgi:hypothetical protein